MKIPVEVVLTEPATAMLCAYRKSGLHVGEGSPEMLSLLRGGYMWHRQNVADLSHEYHLTPIGEQVADFYLSLPF